MPLTKREIVLSKYLLVWLSIVIGTAIGVILSIVIAFITTKQFINIGEILLISSSSIFGVSLLNSVEIPCFYKFGIEKGRICSILFFVILCFGIGILVTTILDLNINFNMNILVKILPIILILLNIIVLLISYSISYKIYKNKEI